MWEDLLAYLFLVSLNINTANPERDPQLTRALNLCKTPITPKSLGIRLLDETTRIKPDFKLTYLSEALSIGNTTYDK